MHFVVETDDDFKNVIAELQSMNSTCTSLRFSSNFTRMYKLSLEKISELSKVLETNTSLQELQLWDDEIEDADAGIQFLAQALQLNTSVKKLILGRVRLSDIGAKALASMLEKNTSLQRLSLLGNNINDNGVAYIVVALKNNKALACLNLERNNITATGAQSLAVLLAVNSALEELNLSNNNIGDIGAAAIAKSLEINNTLKKLELMSTGISENAIKHFVAFIKNNKLSFLDLQHNNINDKGARELAVAIICNQSLEDLQLYANPISIEGAKYLLIASKLASITMPNTENNNDRFGSFESFFRFQTTELKSFSTAVDEYMDALAQRSPVTPIIEFQYLYKNQTKHKDKHNPIVMLNKDLMLRVFDMLGAGEPEAISYKEIYTIIKDLIEMGKAENLLTEKPVIATTDVPVKNSLDKPDNLLIENAVITTTDVPVKNRRRNTINN